MSLLTFGLADMQGMYETYRPVTALQELHGRLLVIEVHLIYYLFMFRLIYPTILYSPTQASNRAIVRRKVGLHHEAEPEPEPERRFGGCSDLV